MVYPSVEEAFPNAVIAENNGLYQETRPSPPYALIGISFAEKRDGRIWIVTWTGEEVTLSNHSVSHTPKPTKLLTSPVQDRPSSEGDVGAVVLVGFGSKPIENGRYQAVFEGKSTPKASCMVNNIIFTANFSAVCRPSFSKHHLTVHHWSIIGSRLISL